jgi:hypothetical protein
VWPRKAATRHPNSCAGCLFPPWLLSVEVALIQRVERAAEGDVRGEFDQFLVALVLPHPQVEGVGARAALVEQVFDDDLIYAHPAAHLRDDVALVLADEVVGVDVVALALAPGAEGGGPPKQVFHVGVDEAGGAAAVVARAAQLHEIRHRLTERPERLVVVGLLVNQRFLVAEFLDQGFHELQLAERAGIIAVFAPPVIARLEQHHERLGKVVVRVFLGVMIAGGVHEVAAPGVGALDVTLGDRVGEEVVALDVENFAEVVAAVELVGVCKGVAQFVPEDVHHVVEGIPESAQLAVELFQEVVAVVEAEGDAGRPGDGAVAGGEVEVGLELFDAHAPQIRHCDADGLGEVRGLNRQPEPVERGEQQLQLLRAGIEQKFARAAHR